MTSEQAITLSIPLRAENVSLVRLTASGISSQLGFDYDAIEDIKVSISEICNKIIELQAVNETGKLEIDFMTAGDLLSIGFRVHEQNLAQLFDEEADAFALAILSSLMDEVLTEGQNGGILLQKKAGRAE